MREDIVYLVVTVGVRQNSYTLKKQAYGWREPKLTQNQYAYKIHIKTDEAKWKERIAEVELDQVKPPNFADYISSESLVEQDTQTKVMERLAQ